MFPSDAKSGTQETNVRVEKAGGEVGEAGQGQSIMIKIKE